MRGDGLGLGIGGGDGEGFRILGFLGLGVYAQYVPVLGVDGVYGNDDF